MFSGIIQGVGTVVERSAALSGDRIHIDLGPLAAPLALGASLAVNGVCLTLADKRGAIAVFDVVHETLRRTTLGRLEPGARVNLEPSLRLGDPLDGHLVQGHVDALGRVEEVIDQKGEFRLWVEAEAAPFLIPKGGIALDGVSLTIAEVQGTRFCVALIPTTLERTCLRDRHPGDRVNIETDIVVRAIVQRVDALLRHRAT